MMYNCYIHGWSHIEQACPKCFPAHIITTSGTTYNDAIIVGINKSELDKLKAENARLQDQVSAITSEWTEVCADNKRYREALESIHDDMSRTVDMKMDHVQEGVEDKAISTILKATTINKIREALAPLKGDITPKKGEEESQWMTKDEFNMHFKMMYSEERMKNYKIWNHRTGEYESCNIFEDLNTAKIAPIEKDKKE